jgi:hypothetical protein
VIRKLNLYESGCDDEATEYFSGHDDQEFSCTGSVTGWHNVKMENLAATGHKVLLYSDGGCLNQIGEVSRDDYCYAAPTDVSGQNLEPAEAAFRADKYSRRSYPHMLFCWSRRLRCSGTLCRMGRVSYLSSNTIALCCQFAVQIGCTAKLSQVR